MTANYKVSGVWKQATPYVNVGGTWKVAKSAWVNLSSQWKSWFLQGGLIDVGFTTGTGANNGIYGVDIQPDGKILIAGGLTTFNGATVKRIARLNSDGTRDTAFTTNIGTGADYQAQQVKIQPDGKIVLCGGFLEFNGTSVGKIVRLNSDGTIDTAFTSNTGTGATGPSNGPVYNLQIQPDGKILVAGTMPIFNGAFVGNIVRLNSDGTRDTAFTNNTGTGTNNSINEIKLQQDGKILISGEFTTFNGATVNKIVRLNSDGTRDTGFTTNIGTGATGGGYPGIYAIAIQPDGKIVIGGGFTTFNGATVKGIARLNSDGTRDTAFTTNTGTGINNFLTAIAIQPDGKIVIGGDFTTFNGATVNKIVRLNSDGTRDTAFTTNTGTGVGFSQISDFAIQADSKILCYGYFNSFNAVVVNHIVRIGGDIAQ